MQWRSQDLALEGREKVLPLPFPSFPLPVKARGANCNFQGILNYSYSIYLQNFKGL